MGNLGSVVSRTKGMGLLFCSDGEAGHPGPADHTEQIHLGIVVVVQDLPAVDLLADLSFRSTDNYRAEMNGPVSESHQLGKLFVVLGYAGEWAWPIPIGFGKGLVSRPRQWGLLRQCCLGCQRGQDQG